uniref:Cap-2 n=1 Tax=Haemonchus contortus TaxID=6289 RepID=A0A0K2DSW2_HAECO|nr:cap-2 [Haemonchus contortus]
MFSLATVAFLTLLSTSGHASMCPDTNGMSDEVRQTFVNKHNAYRTLVAKGEAKNAKEIGGYAPKAARMLKVKYDCAIEENTMNFAKKCVFAHNSYSDRNNWGQNLYMTSILKQNKTEAAAEAVAAWFGDLQKYGVPENNVFTMNIYTTLSHYTQVVWQWSNKIGCAVEWCSDMTFVACEYDSAGNYMGMPIYEVGNPCTNNEDCKCTNCVCSREEALCIAP